MNLDGLPLTPDELSFWRAAYCAVLTASPYADGYRRDPYNEAVQAVRHLREVSGESARVG